jgi:predicted dehydrogenase
MQEIPEFEIVAVADCDAAGRARARKQWGVPVVGSVEEMLEKYDVDLVDVCVPTFLHESVMLKVMEGDKHVFCEKPLARTLEEGQRLIDRSAGYQKKVGIGHVVRFTPAYQSMRQSLEQGEIGKAGVVRTFRGGSESPGGWQNWFDDFDRSGGVILDLISHDLDLCRWLFGEAKRVYAKTTRGRTIERLEHAMIVLRFESGVIAHVEGSWTNFEGEFYTKVEIAGTNGLISYDSRKAKPIKTMTVPDAKIHIGPIARNPYVLELKDMAEAIINDRPPLITARDAFGTLQLALAAIESARTGEVVEL